MWKRRSCKINPTWRPMPKSRTRLSARRWPRCFPKCCPVSWKPACRHHHHRSSNPIPTMAKSTRRSFKPCGTTCGNVWKLSNRRCKTPIANCVDKSKVGKWKPQPACSPWKTAWVTSSMHSYRKGRIQHLNNNRNGRFHHRPNNNKLHNNNNKPHPRHHRSFRRPCNLRPRSIRDSKSWAAEHLTSADFNKRLARLVLLVVWPRFHEPHNEECLTLVAGHEA
mmetsp:Transcript_22091/g.47833  ORF Transcript_22091/g.47833 Transcript_22091/m.47833 type:complete len:222 (+) Transcript_22091:1024-1689(+)